MSLSHLLCAVILAAGIGNAAPTKGKTFSVSQVPINKGFRTHGAHQMLKTYAKFGVTPPASIISATQTSTGTVVAVNADSYDSEYLCQVAVGSSILQLDFDTGSSDLWAFSKNQSSSQTAGHHIYVPSSSAKQLPGYSWNITYGDGSQALGIVYTDTVTVGGVTFTSQAVEAATSVSSSLSSNRMDGLMGLAFDNVNQVKPVQQKTFLSNVLSTMPAPVMTANLKYHSAGTYDFGFIDQSKYTGQITYAPVNAGSGFWQVIVSGYGSPSPVTTTSLTAIVDTGTSLIYLPTSILTSYYSKITGAQNNPTYGGWTVPCKATLPNLVLKIGTYTATVPGKYIIYGPVESTGTTCYGGIQDASGLPFAILGDIFIKSQFVVFDHGSTPRIGFAVPSYLP